MNEQMKPAYLSDKEKTVEESKERSQVLSGQTGIPQGDDCRSQSLWSEVKEEHTMENDVEPLHSEGDEPDLEKYLKEMKEKD